MSTDYDIVIVGAGIAGTCSALHLANRQRILLVDSKDPPAGASAVAAGMVNPFMARKARPAWRYEVAIESLRRTLEMAGVADLFSQRGVLRPARDAEQVEYFQSTAAAFGDCSWLDDGESRERYPEVRAPHGCLMVHRGGAVDIPAFITAAHGRLRERGATILLGQPVIGVNRMRDGAEVVIAPNDSVHCSTLLLACGAGFHSFPELTPLGLHSVKGQTVELRPRVPLDHLPHLAGNGYAVLGDQRVTIGSSFQHSYRNLEPDLAVSRGIVERAAEMLPDIADAGVIAHRAGLRVTVAGHRLPLLGPVTRNERVWAFTGLGSKGLLMAPMIAEGLPEYLIHPERVPREIRIPG